MIISLAISNYKSINDLVFVDFSLNSSKLNKDYSELIFKSKNEYINRVNFFYGKNGAGKSTIVQALRYLKSIALESTNEPDLALFKFRYNFPSISPFKIVNQVKEETFLSLTYFINDAKYRYSIIYNNKSKTIADEMLEFFINDEFNVIYSKLNNVFNRFTDIELDRLKTYKLDNISILAVINDNINVSDKMLSNFLSDSYLFFKNLSFNFDSFEDDESLNTLIDNKVCLNRIIKEIRKFDLSIGDIKLEKREISFDEYLKRYEGIVDNSNSEQDKQLREYLNNRYEKEKNEFKLEFLHNKKALNYIDESDGTKNILDILFSLIVSQKKVWIIDDFENFLHTEAVIELAKYISKGFSDKQFILVTHELDILDLSEMKFKPAHFFVEKDITTLSTKVVNLSDFKDLRSDERNSWKKFYQNYRLGQYPEISISKVDLMDKE